MEGSEPESNSEMPDKVRSMVTAVMLLRKRGLGSVLVKVHVARAVSSGLTVKANPPDPSAVAEAPVPAATNAALFRTPPNRVTVTTPPTSCEPNARSEMGPAQAGEQNSREIRTVRTSIAFPFRLICRVVTLGEIDCNVDVGDGAGTGLMPVEYSVSVNVLIGYEIRLQGRERVPITVTQVKA